MDWENCDGNGGAANNCDNADKNPRIFTDANLARYDAIVLLELLGRDLQARLWADAQKAAIIKYVQNGGGIAGVHNATDMGTTAQTWDWWDGNNGNSVVGATMAGHAATSTANIGQIQVADHNHLATKDLPDQYGFGDEHYNFRRNVRGTHHVLATIDERTCTPGGNAMGQDHPIHVVQALRRRQHQRQHGRGQVLQRRPHVGHVDGPLRVAVHRERRQQQPDQDDRRRRPLGRR